MFRDRQDAGRQLAEALAARAPQRPVVLALPRGGVPVAAEVAARLQAPLDLILVRKIGMPDHAEYAAGAVVDGAEPDLVWNWPALASAGLRPEDLAPVVAAELKTIAQRRADWLGPRPPLPLEGATAIVIDDGIATGATMRAALKVLARRRPARILLAVPCAAPDSLAALRPLADDILCLEAPAGFYAVGAHYAAFPQTSDAEVKAILARYGAAEAAPSPPEPPPDSQAPA